MSGPPGGAAAADAAADSDRAAAEAWFLDHGLPWFVEAEHDRVAAVLVRRRVLRVVVLWAVLGVVAGVAVGWWTASPADTIAVGATVLGAGVVGWALVRVRASVVARWAVRRLLGQLGLLVPLVTRALPLLLIFTVFFFVNTEVWQVSSALSAGSLWLAVLMFAVLATLFLVARLPEEVARVVDEVDDDDGSRLERACAGTPLAARAAAAGSAAGHVTVPLGRLQRVNLLLVLLLVQAGQVVLLAAAVSAFFVLFGVVAIEPSVIESWIGAPPTGVGWSGSPLSLELLKVAVFLAGFSGLYFTVYAVTDPTYREQFFTQITTELERAVGVRAVYATLTRTRP